MEVIVLPEMEVAGAEALKEARERGGDDMDQAIAVYAAMRAIYLMAVLPGQTQAIH